MSRSAQGEPMPVQPLEADLHASCLLFPEEGSKSEAEWAFTVGQETLVHLLKHIITLRICKLNQRISCEKETAILPHFAFF